MKKLTLLLFVLLTSSISLFAQFKASKGAFGFTGSIDGLQNLKLAQQGTIGFRYLIADDMCGRLNLLFNTSGNKSEMVDLFQSGILNTTTTKSSNWGIGIGVSKSFAGTARLDPYVGIDLRVGTTGGGSTVNRMEVTNADSTFSGTDANGDFFQTTVKNAKGMSFGIVPCIGFDYYVAPLFAFGAEFGWGFFNSGSKGGETTTEGTGISTVTNKNSDTNKSGGFGTTGSASISFTVFFK